MSEQLIIGSIVEGNVTRIKPFGALVALDETHQGLVHISQVANGFVKDINDHLAVGDTVKVKILSVDEATGKISLSMREAQPPQERPAPKSYAPRENRKFQDRSFDKDAGPKTPDPNASLDDKLKEWLKQSNERQAGINKRNNRR